MKKIIIFISIIALATGLLGSCGFFLNPTEPSIKDDIYTEYETMMDAFVGIESIGDVSDYLLFWAQTLGIKAQKDRSQSVIIETSGLDISKDDPFITIECCFSLDNLAEDLRAVAISMVLLKELDAAQPLRILFVPYEGQNYYGSKNLPSFYLKNTKMIELNTKDPKDVLTQGAAANVATIEKNIKINKPTYKMAYQVTIDGFNEELLAKKYSEIPNAIKELGSLLATCKSKGMLFEIASFSGSGLSEFAPVSASAIVVVNQNDINSLTYYYGKMEDRLKKAYGELNTDLLVTLSAIELPVSVISNEDTDHLVSFIYTIFNGFCGEDENTFSSLNKIDITDAKFLSSILILNLINADLGNEIDDLNVICNLNYMNYNLKEIHKGWYQNPDSEFVDDFLVLADKKPKGTFLKSPLVEYQTRNKEMEMISYGVDLKDCDRQLLVLKNYIESKAIAQP